MKLACCWVRTRYDGLDEFREGMNESAGKPRCVLANHVSFLDSFLMLGCMPFSEIAGVKTMAAGHLLKLPFIGTICRACGHLIVPFKSSGDSDFSVDKEAAAEVQSLFQEHVADGGIGVWYPEGKMNTGDVTKLNIFRAGGFLLPAKIDCEIWCVAHLGNAACWPLSGLGGKPCNIEAQFFRLCESSKDLADSMPAPKAGEDLLRARSIFLANQAQEAMQAAVDGIISEGWATVLATSGEKEALV